jgi:hypothetical protein
MTRRQNAMMDRKYRKVVVEPGIEYVDKLHKALIAATGLEGVSPIERNLAIYLANGAKLKPGGVG